MTDAEPLFEAACHGIDADINNIIMKYGKITRMKHGQNTASILFCWQAEIVVISQKIPLHLWRQIANIGSLLCWQSEFFCSDSNK
ncbi:MAG: hypothetical protein VZQ80_01325 [Lachnospiraceae bacterium]|nr:hypothetical protein [Lachnospiraceae bacterium]